MTSVQAVPVRTGSHGSVPYSAGELAVAKVHSVLRNVAKPVLSARVTFTMSADPAVARPATAHATIDVNGRIVRAEAAGRTMPEAIEHMADRLRARLDRVAHRPVSQLRAARERHPYQRLAARRARDLRDVSAAGL